MKATILAAGKGPRMGAISYFISNPNIVSRNLILDRNLALKIIRSSREQVTGPLGNLIYQNVLEE